MDSVWFKRRHTDVGISQGDAAQIMGRAPTFFTRVYSGQQRLKVDEAQRLAEILQTPIEEILKRAGLNDDAPSPTTRGFSESDVAAWVPKPDDATAGGVRDMATALAAGQAGRDIWRVGTRAMILAGYAEGDFLLVDQHAAATAEAGDVVIAQVYDWEVGVASTLLRRYDPPVLTAASTDPADWRTHVVDQKNVKIMGVVRASWRTQER